MPTAIQSSSMSGTIPPVIVKGGECALGSEGPATDLGNQEQLHPECLPPSIASGDLAPHVEIATRQGGQP
jgi:hypothetical protein